MTRCRIVIAAGFLLITICPAAASAVVPTFVAKRDLRPIRHLSADAFAVLQQRAIPLVAWRLTAGQLAPEDAAAFLQTNAELSIDERGAVKVLLDELSDNSDLRANTSALRAALSAAIFLDSPRWREKTPAVRDILATRDRLDEFFRRMPATEIDEFKTPWYDTVPSVERGGLDTGQVSNYFVLQVWDACTMRNAIADEMPIIGRDLDQYWVDAKQLGMIDQTPQDLRTAAEADSVLRRRAADEQKRKEAEEADRLAPMTTAVAALDALFTRNHGYGWVGATRHDDPPFDPGGISPGMQALQEYASGPGQEAGEYVADETKYRVPSAQFGALSEEAGTCLASWFRYSMEQSLRSTIEGYGKFWAEQRQAGAHNKQIVADSTSTAQKLIGIYSPGLRTLLLAHYPSDSPFIMNTFPSDPEAIPPYQLVGGQ